METKILIILTSAVLLPGQFAFSEPSLQYFDLGMRYVSGDFGTVQKTTLKQVEMSYGVYKGDYDFSAFISYDKLSDDVQSQSGIGDITLRGSKQLYNEGGYGDYLYGSLAIKLPTADESKGLGTGEVDVGGFINYTHRLNQANLLLSLGYIVAGDSATVEYSDVLNYGVGLSKRIQKTFVYVNLDGRQAVVSSMENPLELTAGLFYQVDINHYLHADAVFGLSDGSPDNGLSLGVTSWF